ncbi:MAG TPA: sigma-54 dependent transcriptional regulator [Pyrinomonadaceae bacterium]|nr:sigma-54 dependent transcriptional regulator [Pyrinomonadaceae bacterium]
MNILLSWIGLTDFKASENEKEVGLGPIAQAVIARKFDSVFLLSNFKKSENAAYLAWLKTKKDLPVEIKIVSLTSPTNFGEIYESVVKIIGSIEKRYEHNISFTFHISPGTPAMAAVWIIIAKTRTSAVLIESSKLGGVKTVSIPFDISAEFQPHLIKTADEQIIKLSNEFQSDVSEFNDIIHQSRGMKEVISLARRIAGFDVPILIEGESGTGKELFAKAIHRAGQRKNKPFIAVNCGAIPSELVESELFGHEKGAFTGAFQKHNGNFLQANGGTIFLDEVGELPLSTQVKLLRVLQEKEITPVGAASPQKIDVRIISATNRTLINEVVEGNFREDLFYRLAVFVLRLPSLREREGDISMLINHFLAKLNKENSGKFWGEDKKITPNARNILLNHKWLGNIRELQNTILRASVLSTSSTISEKEINQAVFTSQIKQNEAVLNQQLGNGFDLSVVIEKVARHYLQKALLESNNNKTKAAKLVGFSSYQTLNNWLDKYKVN